MILDKKHIEKIGHFGTHANAEMKPKVNMNWKPYLDILGVAFDTKPVSIAYLQKKFKKEKTTEESFHIAHEKNVKYISYNAIVPGKKNDVAVYFKMKNIKKAVLIALIHWTEDKYFNDHASFYIIGRLFGYPDKDIESYQYFQALPENWNELSESKKKEIWNTSKVQNHIKKIHEKFVKDKKTDLVKL